MATLLQTGDHLFKLTATPNTGIAVLKDHNQVTIASFDFTGDVCYITPTVDGVYIVQYSEDGIDTIEIYLYDLTDSDACYMDTFYNTICDCTDCSDCEDIKEMEVANTMTNVYYMLERMIYGSVHTEEPNLSLDKNTVNKIGKIMEKLNYITTHCGCQDS